MTLTPQGCKFVEQAKDLLKNAARIEVSDPARQSAKHLRLGCFMDLAPLHLASSLHLLHNALPNTTLTYTVGTFENLLNGQINGQIDIAITYELVLDAGFVRHHLFDSRPRALVSTEHPLARCAQVTLSDLAHHPLILPEEGLSAQHFLGLFRRNGLNPTVAHRAASLEIQRSLAAHGNGIGLSYASPQNRFSYDGRPLVRIPIGNADAVEAVVLARHGTGPADQTVTEAEQVLIEALQAVPQITFGATE